MSDDGNDALSVASSGSASRPRSPLGASRRLSASHGLSHSRLSVQGLRAQTVTIKGFDSARAADFWLAKYGSPCPFFNALENVHVAPGGAGNGSGGSGAFALSPQGRSRTVGEGVSRVQIKRASMVGSGAGSLKGGNGEGEGIGMGGLSPMRPASNPFKLNPADLMKGKNNLTKSPLGVSPSKAKSLKLTMGGDGGDERYLPKSPLNLNSSILKDALKKGKAKLKGGTVDEEDHDVEGGGHDGKRRFSLTRQSSLTSAKREEVSELKSRNLLDSMVSLATSSGYFMAGKDVVCPRDGRVYGRGRFGSVVGGVVRKGGKGGEKKKKEVVSRRTKFQQSHFKLHGGGGSLSSSNSSTSVAVKKVVPGSKGYILPKVLEVVQTEISALLSCGVSPDVTRLLGVTFSPRGTVGLVMELYGCGDMHGLVRSKEWNLVGRGNRFEMLHGMARGLGRIHREGWVHADIKSHNIMVRKREGGGEGPVWEAAIGDFGNARSIGSSRCHVKQGTSGWTAPEVFHPTSGYSYPSDVFSLAFVICDCANAGMDNPLAGAAELRYVQMLRGGSRPSMPSLDGSGINKLVAFMWRFNEDARPTAKQVEERLKDVMMNNKTR
ncbi:hypothetical protein TrRE_jg2110 [Triparma retinervis]|uniref:Protein kinase domain-containing protein n=1 Tax=Triparma retinervis TaxID=2557542 RepID=A0A9W6ZB55_9STRA|nr:hypothetical protein TrRE_jg2110 [Triparma retinervis]